MKKFSKELWLISANKQIEEGTLTIQEKEDAERLWVDSYDGKTEKELSKTGTINPEWFK